MHPTELYAGLAVLATGLFMVLRTARGPIAARHVWIAPASLSAAFLLFSVSTIAKEGIAPVWINHTQNFWGNQVWFDLLIGLTVTWVLILPEAERLGMRRWPWLAAVLATANIALLAMLARVLYLRSLSKTDLEEQWKPS